MSADFSGLHNLFSGLKTIPLFSLRLSGGSGFTFFSKSFGLTIGRRVASDRRLHASDQDVAAKLGKVREDYEGGDQQQPSEHGFRL
jgi:hypothetical protein